MKLGVVGTGMMARLILPHFAGWGVDVVALCGSPSGSFKTAALADEFGIGQRFDEYRALVRDHEIDTVYVALPNSLHREVTLAALDAGKHVICEKPLASNAREAQEMADRAEERGLFLWEAIMSTRQPNFKHVRDAWLPRLGTIKLAEASFTQYSSRYDRFLAGEIAPAFDPAKSGGALMDLGIYCISSLVGLLGEPTGVSYRANIERGIDTSGVVTLDYAGAKAVAICAKDCGAPSFVRIMGTKGSIMSPAEPSTWNRPMTLHLNDGTEETFDAHLDAWWEAEFREFMRQQDEGDLPSCRAQIASSLAVARTMTAARFSAGIVFPADTDRPLA